MNLDLFLIDPTQEHAKSILLLVSEGWSRADIIQKIEQDTSDGLIARGYEPLNKKATS